jgi:hypothetical protein
MAVLPLEMVLMGLLLMAIPVHLSLVSVLHCPPILSWEHLTISSTDTVYATTITATCDEGYGFKSGNRSAVLECWHHGNWNPEQEPCLGMQLSV